MELFAVRYATAFADVAAEAKLAEAAIDTELNDFLSAWDSSAELREIYDNPGIPAEQKVAVLDAMNQKLSLSRPVRNLLAVLINHDRIGSIHAVVEEYRNIARERAGIQQAVVTTARVLSAEQRESMLKQIAELAGSKIEAKFHEDATLKGGAVVRIGSTVYDGSVKGRLERLKETLLKN